MKNEIWVEVFGMPRYRRISDEEASETIRMYPNHLFIKIGVIK